MEMGLAFISAKRFTVKSNSGRFVERKFGNASGGVERGFKADLSKRNSAELSPFGGELRG